MWFRNSQEDLTKDKLTQLSDNQNLVDQFIYNAIKYSKNNTWADYVEKLDLIIENYKKEIK